ncbi:MAG TPA: helix-turn-helix domain-containing protein [Vitreimonas sp.]|nr:helix-turn-helix domain-containing protein [Vitreimonas sp.]
MKNPSLHPVKLYNNVAKFRKSIGVSQLTLAFHIGISRQNVYDIEKGLVVPSVLTALKIAHYLDASVYDLFSLEKTNVLTESEKFDLELKEMLKKAGCWYGDD